MKFRILEKRGKFRIEVNEGRTYYTTTERKEHRTWFGARYYDTDVDVRWNDGEWRFLFDRDGPVVPSFILGILNVSKDESPVKFDTYKQAEAYIKKHYGLEGVKAIEEPEWRQV